MNELYVRNKKEKKAAKINGQWNRAMREMGRAKGPHNRTNDFRIV